ncbi:F11 receptor, tandem duplicate 1 [Cyclopterus lumpus]|uniref:F11 receptor, tandem duplicate 1 n=1 Tax=Cyclopterus lumpus TaxID=8103 RepID=UPI001485CCAD|nr:F11 receptor, tandem duplicate 1 [Cyclopterus lumpus]XP_034407075.1 F11 receptor, tandem duplicate 1 [Cyclopterus lumpus]
MRVSWLVSVALFLIAATGASSLTVTTSNPNVRVKENDDADLTCSYSADFGADPIVVWKFTNLKGSQIVSDLDNKPTTPYANRVTMYGSSLRFSKVTSKDNGVYDCEVANTNGQSGKVQVTMTALVPPSAPLCRIPTSVTTGRKVTLTCHDKVGSPPPKYKWFKNSVLLPPEPSKTTDFKNATYKLNTDNGDLVFPAATKMDSGQYFCEAFNDAGPPQRSKVMKMEVRDVNTGGIVAGVIVALLLVVLLVFGIWYAHKKGYLPKKTERKPKPSVVYQQAGSSLYGGEDEDGEFKQKSSFVV